MVVCISFVERSPGGYFCFGVVLFVWLLRLLFVGLLCDACLLEQNNNNDNNNKNNKNHINNNNDNNNNKQTTEKQ